MYLNIPLPHYMSMLIHTWEVIQDALYMYDYNYKCIWSQLTTCGFLHAIVFQLSQVVVSLELGVG